ncbi:preprotein translocase subunit SecE [Hymenobacter sp. DG01]|uniref:preprotein translocase subunit SecE n=1 Tax=Hymenobacter sp. DG01 TaxID=2584940 RepID=UPI0027E39356|nr:preprotein translocase subunit SecE [Hymenobacter sp. DG01]
MKTTAASAAVVLTHQTGAITMSKLTNYFRETSEEMRYKVTWPSLEELQKSAGLVLIGSLLFAAVVGLMDVIFNKGLDAFYNSFR